MGHYVYKYVFNGEIIYIGKCDSDLDQRLRKHGKSGDNINKKYWDDINASDVYYCTLANATMSDVVESELINRYKPKCNTAKISNWDELELPEPKWKKYNKPKKILFVKKGKDLTKTDETKELIKTLQNTVESLKQQLTVKDGQIDELTSMLKTSQEQQTTLQEQNTTLVSALSAAQTLHAVTMQERHEEKKLDSQEKNSKTGLLARIFRKFGW